MTDRAHSGAYRKGVCISKHVESYCRPSNLLFCTRIIRAVEVRNGLEHVQLIRKSGRMKHYNGLYYHRGEIALQSECIPYTALHELGHHWHLDKSSGESESLITELWNSTIGMNDISNDYEARFVDNVRERIAESFALFMIDCAALSDAKLSFFHRLGLVADWANEYNWLVEIDVPLEHLTNTASHNFRKPSLDFVGHRI